MAALVLDIQSGDEVIVPSYTFISTANAFLLRGASLVFVDVVPETMNMDLKKLQEAIAEKTRAVVPVHYAGVSCDMDAIMDLVKDRGIYVVEDAAQGLFSTYKARPLGTFGHIGCISFHEIKNVTSGGQGGAIVINDPSLSDRAEIIRDKGTNRPQFMRGEINHYSWQQVGASYVLSETLAAYLWAQLEDADHIQNERRRVWDTYWEGLSELAEKKVIELPLVPEHCQHNAHMFFIKVRDADQRREFTKAMKENGVTVLAHYSPLHATSPGSQGRHILYKEDFVTWESQRLVRLPLFPSLTTDQTKLIVDHIKQFFSRHIGY